MNGISVAKDNDNIISNTRNNGVLVNGKEYTSLVDLATDLNIPARVIVRRLLRGCSFSESIKPCIKHNGVPQEILYKGVHYKSKVALCRALDLRVNSLDTLVNSGHSLDSAIKYLLNVKATRKYREAKGLVTHRSQVYNTKPISLVFPLEFEGKPYTNLTEIARAYRLNYNTFRSRLKWGWSLDEAVYGRKK